MEERLMSSECSSHSNKDGSLLESVDLKSSVGDEIVSDNNNMMNESCSSSLIYPMIKSSLRASTKAADLHFQNCLLFAGLEKPPDIFSKWWLAWIGWRVCLVGSVFSNFYGILKFEESKPWLTPYFLIPSLFASIIAGISWLWLPGVRRSIVEQGGPELTCKDAKSATTLYTRFITINMTVGVGITISRYIQSNYDALIACLVFFQLCGTTVVLGGVLLVLNIETTLAKKEVREVMQAAREQTLTRSFYSDAVKSIRLRSLRWQWPLNSLVFVACYCAVCLIILQFFMLSNGRVSTSIFHKSDDDEYSAITVDVEVTNLLLKETMLLIIILYLIMGINDEADAITAELLDNNWGLPGSQLDCARLDLLFMSTTVAAPLDAVKSWYSYFFTSKLRPISFRVLHLRITREYVLAIGLSLLIGVTNIVLRAVDYS
jgi:hypothetical protein